MPIDTSGVELKTEAPSWVRHTSPRLFSSVTNYSPKVGDWVKTNGDLRGTNEEIIEGEVMEVGGDHFFIFQNDRHGSTGKKNPKNYGYKYSWKIYTNNDTAWIKVCRKESLPYYEVTSDLYSPGKVSLTRDECDLGEIIKPKKKSMLFTLNTMMKKLLDADTQKLVKAGYINGDLELTCKGSDALREIAFDKYREDLVKKAEEVIAEAEKSEKTK